ncbi:MAG: response regulator, partial [Burkholderiales bacterium]
LQAEQRSAVLRLEHQVVQRTAELVGARDAALQADREKTFFLAKVSHELRTPLHSLLGYLELSRRETSVAGIRQRLGPVEFAGRELARQVDDLLDFARLGREQLVLHPSTTTLYAVARRVIERAQLLADESGNELRLLPNPDLPGWVEVDANRLEQILMVLLSNALRYTRHGTVTLSLTAASPDEDATSTVVVFEVRDTGRGIAADALTTIFRPFERGQSNDGEGLGLGLPIAQQLLRAMGSEMRVTSQPGVGSCFNFGLRLPHGNESNVQETHADHNFTGYRGHTRHVMVLDDNPTNLGFLRELLGDVGFAVSACADVASATALLLPDAKGRSRIGLCIVDQRLGGGKSGWDFIAALRRQSEASGWARVPVLMLSANEPHAPEAFSPDDAPERHLCKPAEPAALLQTVGELLNLNWDDSRARHGVLPKKRGSPSDAHDASSSLQAVLRAAETGDVSALDAWCESHADWLKANPALARAIQALDFAHIAEQARKHIASAEATDEQPAQAGCASSGM